MELGVISIIISGGVFLWAIYRDKKNDFTALNFKNQKIDTQIILLEEKVKNQSELFIEMSKKNDKLETSINSLNLNVNRILTILEQK